MKKVSRHNSRSGSHGVFNPKHNDREFDVDKSTEINSELTKYNIYWNCFDREIVLHGERTEKSTSFTDVEKGFYDLVYKDYVEGQNARNVKGGHRKRNHTTDDLRTNDKTCPEESIHQIGNFDEHVEPEILLAATMEFLNEVSKRYGSHFHILDWALHVDEGTPHIHERHVFDVINKYGERQPKQEQALKELGFELPDPRKKPGQYNNRKMVFDEELKKLSIEICKKYVEDIDSEPTYGGRAYKEKQEYIRDKIRDDIEKLSAENSELVMSNATLQNKNNALELRIEDTEALIKNVSEVAYNKACNTLIDSLACSISKEEAKEISKIKLRFLIPIILFQRLSAGLL